MNDHIEMFSSQCRRKRQQQSSLSALNLGSIKDYVRKPGLQTQSGDVMKIIVSSTCISLNGPVYYTYPLAIEAQATCVLARGQSTSYVLRTERILIC